MPFLRFIPGLGRNLVNTFDTPGDRVSNFLHASLFQKPSELVAVRPEADFASVLARRREIFNDGRSDHLSNCLKFDMQAYMVDLLVRQTRSAIVNSMENRIPFFNSELVSFVRRLPPTISSVRDLRVGGNRMRNTKVLLEELAERTFQRILCIGRRQASACR